MRGVDLHREVLAAAEGAADAGEVDPHLLGREAEARRDLVAVDVEPLRRDVDVDAALAVRHGEPRLGPEEGLVLARRARTSPSTRDLALGVGVAVPDHDRADDVRPRVVAVAVAHRRPVGVERLLLGRALGVDDGLERLVLDDDRLGRAARLLGMLGGDERDRLAVVADAVDREHRLVGELEPVGLRARDVGVREHGVDAGHRRAPSQMSIDAIARVRVRAAQRVAPEHPGRAEVARVRELAVHLRRHVRPRDDGRDARPRASVPAAVWTVVTARAAACTASKIFW